MTKKYLLPWKSCGKPYENGSVYRPTIREYDGYIFGVGWVYHIRDSWTCSYSNKVFPTKEEAMAELDRIHIELGYVILPEKLVVLL